MRAREDLTNVQFPILNSHPKGEAAACVRAVLRRGGTGQCQFRGRRRRCTNSGWPVGPTLIIEAEAIRQSSLFSARMSTSNSGEIKELLAMMRIQNAVSLSSFCTIRIL